MSPRRLRLGPRITWIPMAALVIVGGASAVVSYDPLLSLYHGIRLFALFWFYLFIVNEIHSAGWVLIPAGIQDRGTGICRTGAIHCTTVGGTGQRSERTISIHAIAE